MFKYFQQKTDTYQFKQGYHHKHSTMETSYDAYAESFSRTRHSLWPAVTSFLDQLPKYALLADVGCGNGKYANYLPNTVYIGIDLSRPLLNCALSKHSSLIQASALHLPLKDTLFDAVISIAVLHHMPTHVLRKEFLKELVRIANNKILVSVWAAQDHVIKKTWECIGDNDYIVPWQNTHKRFYHLFTEEELRSIFEEVAPDFQVIITYERDNWYAEATRLPRKVP